MNNNELNLCTNSLEKWEHWTGSNRCPNCGGDEIECNTQLVLTSYPPQSQLRCKSCGHIFSSGFEAEHTNQDILDKLWDRDQSILNTPYIGDPPPGSAPYIGDAPGNWKWPTPCDPPSYPDIYIPGKNSNVGWICPKCGRCLAPHLNVCIYCEEN